MILHKHIKPVSFNEMGWKIKQKDSSSVGFNSSLQSVGVRVCVCVHVCVRKLLFSPPNVTELDL